MTGLMREWLLGLACAAMAAALAQALAPEGGAKRVCRLAGALVLLLAAVSPVLRLDEAELADLAGDWQHSAQAYTQALEEENDLLYKTIIEERAAAYIVDKAAQLGVSCQAQVTCRVQGEQAAPLPWRATVTGRFTQPQREQLAQVLEQELGIPPERQRFEEAGS